MRIYDGIHQDERATIIVLLPGRSVLTVGRAKTASIGNVAPGRYVLRCSNLRGCCPDAEHEITIEPGKTVTVFEN